ncbi:LOW QUALITY PROTEIN: hypothetical protein RvY_06319 [Ramazzottius varieornatus]|uniref:Transposase Tc1-like domain-containing protein n=1 Tax=Ramazzottius varieornatus TaxID=947166 RepID=A0A1D1UY38_RAMVA|nr:LOW QUALITY PROTEIN: hypothetical protein RvY_06319 [Ramazzottius varieornatus]
MGRKLKEYSDDIRNRVIKKHLYKVPDREIARQMLLPHSSVNFMITYKETGSVQNKPRCGRERITTPMTDRLIVQRVLKDRRISAPKIKEETQPGLLVSISKETVRRRIREKGLNGRVARKKPLIKEHARQKRLDFGKRYGEMPVSFWDNVLWSDESKFNLFEADGKVMVRRKPSEAYRPECTVPTVKHGGGNVMV